LKKLAKDIYQKKSMSHLAFTLSKNCVSMFLMESLYLIIPGMIQKKFENENEIEILLTKHLIDLRKILNVLESDEKIGSTIKSYENEILILLEKIELDALAIQSGDPAANSLSEVLICYPGLYATAVYRLAHFFII